MEKRAFEKLGIQNVTSWIWMYEISIDSGSED